MNALLRLIPIQKIIEWILAKCRGITSAQWKHALEVAVKAAQEFPSSEYPDNITRWNARRDWAIDQILATGALPGQARWLVETAASFIQAPK